MVYEMNEGTLWIVLGSIMFLGSLFVVIIWDEVYAENFKFNMTQELKEETHLLQFCMVDHKMLIPDVETFCSTRYGGLNTTYGEAIK